MIFNRPPVTLHARRCPQAGQEAAIAKNTQSDFAALLDDLFAEKPAGERRSATRPTIPFDYLAVAEELHSGRIKVSGLAAGAEYREIASASEGQAGAGEAASEPEDRLPAIEPEAIALELGLEKASAADCGRLRRSFALLNHPDRVAPHLRERALTRMQVANRLIDEAKRRALARAKG